jgi:hypothetical protein
LITPFHAGSTAEQVIAVRWGVAAYALDPAKAERLLNLSAELIALPLDATLRDVQAGAVDVEG